MTRDQLRETISTASEHARTALLVVLTFSAYLLLTVYQEQKNDVDRALAATNFDSEKRQLEATQKQEERALAQRDDLKEEVSAAEREKQRFAGNPNAAPAALAVYFAENLDTLRGRIRSNQSELDAIARLSSRATAEEQRCAKLTPRIDAAKRVLLNEQERLLAKADGAYQAFMAAKTLLDSLGIEQRACHRDLKLLQAESKSASQHIDDIESQRASLERVRSERELALATEKLRAADDALSAAHSQMLAAASKVGAAKDALDELEKRRTLKLPIIDVEVAPAIFLTAAPVLLFLLFGYFQLEFTQLGSLVQRYLELSTEGPESARYVLHPSLLTRAHVGLGITRWIAFALAHLSVPLVLGLIAFRVQAPESALAGWVVVALSLIPAVLAPWRRRGRGFISGLGTVAANDTSHHLLESAPGPSTPAGPDAGEPGSGEEQRRAPGDGALPQGAGGSRKAS